MRVRMISRQLVGSRAEERIQAVLPELNQVFMGPLCAEPLQDETLGSPDQASRWFGT